VAFQTIKVVSWKEAETEAQPQEAEQIRSVGKKFCFSKGSSSRRRRRRSRAAAAVLLFFTVKRAQLHEIFIKKKPNRQQDKNKVVQRKVVFPIS